MTRPPRTRTPTATPPTTTRKPESRLPSPSSLAASPIVSSALVARSWPTPTTRSWTRPSRTFGPLCPRWLASARMTPHRFRAAS
ncbi:hypothetical protein BCR44DRAFT_1424125 [Catenaria anguillulae PL171]|uniref:Uncharacterized protein n=1 Tax=Catenaria anguillulae PL171 TaxID=765915 RepID=A0A1Y2I4N3_9FUNG|nr:hypothetical protein BCR44DRAFT_1424125 [Catenaria anguillulae PL171]